jgi:hypothetical protein
MDYTIQAHVISVKTELEDGQIRNTVHLKSDSSADVFRLSELGDVDEYRAALIEQMTVFVTISQRPPTQS